jgi:hypothetical protein
LSRSAAQVREKKGAGEMAVIKVPRPPKSAFNPNRPMSSLLEWQVEHLHEAEKRLPVQHRTDIYINAIKTEGEAANYIRAVTEAIHAAHAEAEAMRAQRAPAKRKIVIEIAAAADEAAENKRARRARVKKKSTARGKK